MFAALRASALSRFVTLASPFLLSACTQARGPQFRFLVAGPAQNARCLVPQNGAFTDNTLTAEGISLVRVSVRQNAADSARNFICDRVFPASAEESFKIPLTGESAVDVYVEGFAPLTQSTSSAKYARVAMTVRKNLDPKNRTTLAPLRLVDNHAFACAASSMVVPRAFHTTTVLPDGRVLIVGGLTATPDSTNSPSTETISGGLFYLTATAEIYDPATAKFTAAIIDGTPIPRAMHHAAILSTNPLQIVLVGGATIADGSQPAFARNLTGQGITPLVPSINNDGLHPMFFATAAAPTTLLTFNGGNTFTASTPTAALQFSPGVFQAAAISGTGIIVDAGVTFMSAGTPYVTYDTQLEQERSTGASIDKATQAVPRIGASLSAIDGGRAILYGGDINPNPGDPTSAPAIAEVVAGIGTSNLASTPVTNAGGTPYLLAGPMFHTATTFLADPNVTGATSNSVLVTGGFMAGSASILATEAMDPTQKPIDVIAVSTAGLLTITPVTVSTYVPAAWEAAAALTDRSVLVTGGATGANQTTCDDLLCTTNQAFLYTHNSTTGITSVVADATAPAPLQVPRAGHAITVLDDFTLLVTGGVSYIAAAVGAGSDDDMGESTTNGATHILADAELFNENTQATITDATMSDPSDPLASDLALGDYTRLPGQGATRDGATFPCPLF